MNRRGVAGLGAAAVGLVWLAVPAVVSAPPGHGAAPAGAIASPGPSPRDLAPVAPAPAPAPAIASPAPPAHEIPADVVIRAIVKADSGALRIVVRVPLASMRDVDFPVRGPGYVDIEGATPLLIDQATLWIAGYLALFEEEAALPAPVVEAARISLPSDPSFADFDRAAAHVRAPPLPPATELILEQAALDAILAVPVASETSRFSIDPRWAHLGLRTTTVLRFVTPEGAERVFQYRGDPGRVRLDPRWHQALLRFVALGFAHILDGIDHLLFLLCLIVPMRRVWPLVAVVTSFTAAHSITLAASVAGIAPDGLWFPPLIETLIAASILFMAIENALGKTLRRRWMWAFGFGLVHGFGFAFQLRESLQFAGSHLFTSLLGFNVGVELGQLFALAVMAPAVRLLFAKATGRRAGTVLVSALVAHSSWHWMAERWAVLTAYDLRWPAVDAAFGAAALRWVALLLIVILAAWGLGEFYRRVERRAAGRERDAADADGDAGARGADE